MTTMTNELIWESTLKRKTKVSCTIIDLNNVWHEHQMLDTHGQDLSACTFGYYGSREPLLVEIMEGEKRKLRPFVMPDAIGESPHLVYIANKSASYKAFMAVPSDLLRKLQLGLMAALAFGVLFLIYILAQPPKNQGEATAGVLERRTTAIEYVSNKIDVSLLKEVW